MGDLRIGLDAPKGRYAQGETMVLTVRAENTGEKPLTLAHFEDDMWWYRVVFQSTSGGPSFEAANQEHLDFASSPDVVLEPGAVWEKELRLTERGHLQPLPRRSGGDDLEHLPPGRYDAVLEYTHRERGEAGYWIGRAWSNVLTLVVE